MKIGYNLQNYFRELTVHFWTRCTFWSTLWFTHPLFLSSSLPYPCYKNFTIRSCREDLTSKIQSIIICHESSSMKEQRRLVRQPWPSNAPCAGALSCRTKLFFAISLEMKAKILSAKRKWRSYEIRFIQSGIPGRPFSCQSVILIFCECRVQLKMHCFPLLDIVITQKDITAEF